MREESKNRAMKCLARITILGAVIGCVFQIWTITDDYLKKEVVTEIKIETPRLMVVPDFSFCSRLPFLLNYEKISEIHPEFINVIQNEFPNVTSSREYGELMRIRSGYKFVFKELTSRYKLNQIFEMMYRPSDIFFSVNIISNIGFGYVPEEEMKQRCEWTTFSKEHDACFRLTCAKKGRYEFTLNDLSRGLFQDEVVEFKLIQNVFTSIPNFKIILHTPGSYPRGQQVASTVLKSFKKAHIYYMAYKRFETNLFPPPFTTNCVNYTEQGFDSRLHKVESCQSQLSMQRMNCPFNGNIHSMQLDAHHPYVNFFSRYQNETFQKIVSQIHAECDQIANEPDCKEEFFIPKEKQPREWQGEYSLLMLNPPTEPDIIHITKDNVKIHRISGNSPTKVNDKYYRHVRNIRPTQLYKELTHILNCLYSFESE